MTTYNRIIELAFLCLIAQFSAPFQVKAASFSFSLEGFNYDGILSGNFQGNDLTGDNLISFEDNEITSYFAEWTPNNTVPGARTGFTHEILDLQSLEYDLNNNIILDLNSFREIPFGPSGAFNFIAFPSRPQFNPQLVGTQVGFIVRGFPTQLPAFSEQPFTVEQDGNGGNGNGGNGNGGNGNGGNGNGGNGQKIPESSLSLSLLAIGSLGLGLKIIQKHMISKS